MNHALALGVPVTVDQKWLGLIKSSIPIGYGEKAVWLVKRLDTNKVVMVEQSRILLVQPTDLTTKDGEVVWSRTAPYQRDITVVPPNACAYPDGWLCPGCDQRGPRGEQCTQCTPINYNEPSYSKAFWNLPQ